MNDPFTGRFGQCGLELRHYPDQFLRGTANAVHTYDAVLQELASQMVSFMRANRGIGLAASQIGVSYRIVTADVKGVAKCLINPEILSVGGESEADTEGCLSIPGRFFDVRRSFKIEIRARNTHGQSLHFEAEGLAARVLQHEIDHLNGILICDRGVEIKVKND